MRLFPLFIPTTLSLIWMQIVIKQINMAFTDLGMMGNDPHAAAGRGVLSSHRGNTKVEAASQMIGI